MKCRIHSSFDRTSTVGVCASCLREQLFILISTQSQYHLHHHHNLHNQSQSQAESHPSDHRRNSDPNHHHTLTFPRSVSPYVTSQKFNDDFSLDFSYRQFHSTPQIGCAAPEKNMTKKKKKNKFSFITNLFKSRSDKSESNPSAASTSSPLWCPAGSKPKPVPNFVNERLQTQNRTRTRSKVSDRGMSPEWEDKETSSRSSESSEPKWKQTPVSTTSGGQPMRRRHSNMSGLAFCLSPLVRASPNRNWNWNWNRNSFPIESGDNWNKNSFGKNRSKKMADFGTSGVGGFDHRR